MKPTTHATTTDRIPTVLILTVPPDERESEAERSAEMRSLLDTAGRDVVADLVQHLRKPVGRTYIGTGKIEELAELVRTSGAAQVAFDVRLSPSQQRNLEAALSIRVLDYDELILDIFARNARTHQALLAVELARLEYDKSRLKRMWSHLDRQRLGGSSGAGSGFLAGTGEKQIEMDRRLVRKRIQVMRHELAELDARKDRAVATRARCFSVCLVGYTNAGKSTLMNALTRAGVLAEDRLFATLDTRSHRLHLDGVGRAIDVVLSDTVGFIRNLPPQLIASFHATLAEVREADLLLHVVDASSKVMEDQISAVDGVLKAIGADAIPTIMVCNKTDRVFSKTLLASYRRRADAVSISALTGDGLDALRERIQTLALASVRTTTVRFPIGDGAIDALIRRRAGVTAERYDDEHGELTIAADDQFLAELSAHPQITLVATATRQR